MDLILFGLAGVLFVFFTITGWELEQAGNISWTAGRTALILILSLALGIVFGVGMRFLFQLLEKRKEAFKETTQETTKEEMRSAGKMRPSAVFGISFGSILLSRLPVFLAFYPGICAYDVSIQLGQVGSGAYNLHHPLAHTLLLKFAIDFGNAVFHDPTTGFAWMVFGQILFLSAAMAFGVTFLYRRGCGKGWLIFLQAFWMVYPFLAYINVSVTKDVIFAIFFLLQVIGLLGLAEGKKSYGFDALFIFSCIFMQFFRNNGTYALLFLDGILFLCLLFGKKERKLYGKIFLEGIVGLIGGVLCLSVLTKVTGAQPGDSREMLSVPIQQMARCMVYHGGIGENPADDGTMDEKDKALINDFLLYESYRKYDEKLADPVKSNTNTYVARYRSKDFIRTYLHLLKEYPGDMVNAFLALNSGYFYLGDESHGRIYELRQTQGLSYAHTRWDPIVEEYGIFRHSMAEGLREKMVSWADGNGHLRIPVLKWFLAPAIIFWGFLFVLLDQMRKKKWAGCLPFALVAGYYLTLFLGPAVQLRYLFPLIVAFPFLFCHAFMTDEGCREESVDRPSAQ